MEPFERFKQLNTEGNLWIYILTLGNQKEEIPDENVKRLVFENFGFLPSGLLVATVLYRLRREGYIKSERFKGKKAFTTTEKGVKEFEKMKNFSKELLDKLLEKI